MRVGIYLRVSTDRQDTANQLPELRQLCLARKWSAEVTEEVESGAKARPKLDALCDAACWGHVGGLVFSALDRLGRNALEIIGRVHRLLAANVRIVSLREPWLEQDGPARQLLLFIFAWVAEQERRRLIERTNDGIAKARAKGVRLGRPPADPAAVAAALAEYDALPTWVRYPQSHGRGPKWKRLAARHGISEGTLRRAAAARAKKGTEKPAALPSKKKRRGRGI